VKKTVCVEDSADGFVVTQKTVCSRPKKNDFQTNQKNDFKTSKKNDFKIHFSDDCRSRLRERYQLPVMIGRKTRGEMRKQGMYVCM